MEERKRVVRAFIEGLTVVGSSRSGELRMKKLPLPQQLSNGSSFEMVAGACSVANHDFLSDLLSPYLRNVIPLPRRVRGPARMKPHLSPSADSTPLASSG